MSRFILTDPSQNDLQEIWDYIARDNIEAADRVLADIYDMLTVLSATPKMGRQREGIAPGIRSFPVGSHLIFYRETEGDIEVLRVLHGARDIESLLRAQDSGI